MLEGDSMAKPTLRKGTTSLCLIFRLIQVAQHVFFNYGWILILMESENIMYRLSATLFILESESPACT